jgi:hypothetical protein
MAQHLALSALNDYMNSIYQFRRIIFAVMAAVPVVSFANYNCAGTVGYLGIDAGGDVAVALSAATPIHKICNIVAQGGFGMSVSSCKATYAAFLSAKLAGMRMVVYYNENGMSCSSLPNWGEVPAVYFVQGPD